MSHTTYNNVNVQLFHHLHLWWRAGKHSPGCFLLCTTSFKHFINPQKLHSFRTKLCPFLWVKKQQPTYCCHSERWSWEVEDIPGCLKSLCHHHWATENWGLASLATVGAPSAPITISCKKLQMLRAWLLLGLTHSWLFFTALKISWMEKIIFTVQNNSRKICFFC